MSRPLRTNLNVGDAVMVSCYWRQPVAEHLAEIINVEGNTVDVRFIAGPVRVAAFFSYRCSLSAHPTLAFFTGP